VDEEGDTAGGDDGAADTPSLACSLPFKIR